MVDQGKRSKYTEASRMLVRADGDLSEMFAGYLADGGKPAGWRQIVNEIYLSEDGAGAEALLKSSAKHPGIAGIMEGYAF
jgi:hypothetical protein